MSLVIGTNSWATRAEADAYLTDRIGATDWFTLEDTPVNPGEDSKDSYLISAYQWLIGAPQLTISAASTDANVKKAQIEAALFLIEHYLELNERRAAISTGVTRFKYSKREEDLNANNLSIPDYILGMIESYTIINTTAVLLGEYDV